MGIELPGGGIMYDSFPGARRHRRTVAVKKWLLLLLGIGIIAGTVFIVNRRSAPVYEPVASKVSVRKPAVVEAPAVKTQPALAAPSADAVFTEMQQDMADAPLPPLQETVEAPTPAPAPTQETYALPKAAEDVAAGAPSMAQPRFHGVDAKQRPFNVTADAASWPDKTHAQLQAVRADAALEDGFAEMQADEGNYAIDHRVLQLKGNVVLRATKTDDTRKDVSFAEVRTSEITAELEQQRAYGNAPVTMESNMGTLKAEAFGYDAVSGVAVFTGGVVLTLDTEALQHTSQAITP